MTAPTPGTPATTWQWRGDEVDAAWAADDADDVLDALAPLMAARVEAAREEGRAEEAERSLAHFTAQTKRTGELRTEADEILAGVTAVADENDALRAEVARLRADVAAARQRGADAERSRLFNVLRDTYGAITADRIFASADRAAAAAVPDTTPEGGTR